MPKLDAALTLYLHLQACKGAGIEAPKKTGHIVCGEVLCEYLMRVLAIDGLYMPFNVVAGAFQGEPVKRVFALVPYALRIGDLMERDHYLRYQARKREEAA